MTDTKDEALDRDLEDLGIDKRIIRQRTIKLIHEREEKARKELRKRLAAVENK